MTRGVFAVALLGLALTACASTAPAPDARDLAGAWRGRMATSRGHAAAAMTVKDDGTYAGTLYFDGVDRAFHGAIVAPRPGELRYMGSEGDGVVTVRGGADGSVLRFVGDDGATGARFTRQP